MYPLYGPFSFTLTYTYRAKEKLFLRTGQGVNRFCMRIPFHKKDPLVSHSQSSILSCDITNAELPDFNRRFNITNSDLTYLDAMQSKTVSIF